jgi:hypothetical protein
MRAFFKRFSYVFLAAVLCLSLQKFCKSKTDGFAMSKITSEMTYHKEFETSPLSNEELDSIRSILDQPYHYLGKGVQCFAFVSADDKYVLKFFRMRRVLPSNWLIKIPLLESYKQEKIKRKFEDLSRDFISYKIAYEQLKDETGLLYIHLNKTDILHQKITLFDKIRVKHTIDMDSMEFLLQKKADLFYPAVEEMLSVGKNSEIKQCVKDLIHLLAYRSSLGIYDKDPDINTNFGICEGKTLQIDVGRYRPDPTRKDPSLYIDDIVRVTDNLRQWLEAQDPELSDFLLQEIQNLKSKELRSAS